MQINNDNSNKGWQKDIPDRKEKYDDDGLQRDLELENIAGNLMIVEYQVDKLEQRLSQHVIGVGYHSFNNMKKNIFSYFQIRWKI